MIDLKTLQIGDLLKHINGTICYVSKIEEGRGFACKPVNDKISQHLWSYNNEFEPIPLTEEMLSLNSFEPIEDYNSAYRLHSQTNLKVYIVDVFICNDYIITDVYEEIENKGVNKCQITMHYVHELQHILNICRLNDWFNLKLK